MKLLLIILLIIWILAVASYLFYIYCCLSINSFKKKYGQEGIDFLLSIDEKNGLDSDSVTCSEEIIEKLIKDGYVERREG